MRTTVEITGEHGLHNYAQQHDEGECQSDACGRLGCLRGPWLHEGTCVLVWRALGRVRVWIPDCCARGARSLESATRLSVRWSRRVGLCQMHLLHWRGGKKAVEPARDPPCGAAEDLHDAG